MKKTMKTGMLLGGICLSILIGAVSVSAMTNYGAFTQVKSQISTASSEKIICDTDGNGTVDLVDANMVLKYALKIVDSTNDSASGDADQDGSVTLNDANLVLKYALKILDIPTDGPEVTTEPTPTTEPTVSPEPTPTPIVYMEPNAQLLSEHGSEIYQKLGLEVLAQWASGSMTQEEAEAKANVIVRELCGVIYHVKWFPYNQKSDAYAFWDERIKIVKEAGFSSYTMQMISAEDIGCFLIYF